MSTTISQNVTLIVVVLKGKIICVYLNGERISGRKPSPIKGAVYLEKVICRAALLAVMEVEG